MNWFIGIAYTAVLVFGFGMLVMRFAPAPRRLAPRAAIAGGVAAIAAVASLGLSDLLGSTCGVHLEDTWSVFAGLWACLIYIAKCGSADRRSRA